MQKIFEKLAAIQAEIHSPKDQYNTFGKYSYRTAEQILEAVKPLLKAQGCLLNCTDELLLIGERYYIKATAVITCVEDGSQVLTTAFAREEEEKKGMDGSQVTGASSSYARKYALNGLLCIDNTPDSDATNDGTGTTSGKGKGKSAGKKPQVNAAEQAGTKGPQVAKNPAPERGSDTWDKWVEAIVTKKPAKSGEAVDWMEAFKQTYIYDQDVLDCLEEDCFNYRVDNGARANG